MTLDYDGRQTLARLQEYFGDESYQDVPDCEGTDHGRRLGVILDAAQRVVDVILLDRDRLRAPSDLIESFDEAWFAADVIRLQRALEISGTFEARAQEGAAIRAGTVTVSIGTPPDVEEPPDWPSSLGDGDTLSPLPPSATVGRSNNGYLAIRRPAAGPAKIIDVDAGWLATADAGHLRRALREAATAPGRADESQG